MKPRTQQQGIEAQLAADLQRDFDLTPAQTAGVIGNLSHETAGFRFLQEIQPVIPGSRGGYGFAQWTASRRDAFEAWAKERGLSIKSYAANYGFLAHELRTTERESLRVLKRTQTPKAAAQSFSKRFLRPGIPHTERRTDLASQIFRRLTGGV